MHRHQSSAKAGSVLGHSLLPLLLLTALPAQVLDPQPPPSGFEVAEELDVEVAYLDGGRTRIDIRYPETEPGPLGWPVVIVVHGLGGTRKDEIGYANTWASRGFLSAAYDVRGQGSFRELSPAHMGTELIGEAERLDLVEIVAFLQDRYGQGLVPLADTDRLGLTGLSQGGAHAWAAAAWSGRNLPANDRGLTRFPEFRAVTPNLMPPFTSEVPFPQHSAVQNSTLKSLFIEQNVNYLAWFGDGLRSAILREDFEAAAGLIDRNSFRRDKELLASSEVPIYAQLGWNDAWAGADGVLEAIKLLPDDTPGRAFLGPTWGHELVLNMNQVQQHVNNWDRWMAKFLKGENSGIDKDAVFVTGVVAATRDLYDDPLEMIWNRHHDDWPPAHTSMQRFFLRKENQLSAMPPQGPEPRDLIKQVVDKGFDMRAYIEEAKAEVTATMEKIPLSSIHYDSPALEEDVELAGSPTVSLLVSPDSDTYQIHAALYQVSVAGTERFLASGMALVRGDKFLAARNDATTDRIEIKMIPTNAIILAGERIRLRIENLTYRTFGQQENLWVAPYFNDFSYRIEHSSVRQSWFDMPLRSTVQPALSISQVSFDIDDPKNIRYNIEAPPGLAGRPYQVYFSASGTDVHHQQMSGTDPLRLVEDQVTRDFLHSKSTLLAGMSGVLSEEGDGEAWLLLSEHNIHPSLRGLRLSTAVIVQGQFGPIATNPVDLYIK
ncbi:MAG: CocE/NonD family hydrolase C-terminal non-catalytic domain-containing protein [Planctomycetota bacterium]|jgi:predicted acyl esterase